MIWRDVPPVFASTRKTWVKPFVVGPVPSAPHTVRSTRTAPFASSAPLGVFGSLMGSGEFSSRTRTVNAIFEPSGDHRGADGSESSRVSWAISRVSSHIAWIWVEPERFERKAIRFPSGENAAEESRNVPSVNWRSRSPRASTIHSEEAF